MHMIAGCPTFSAPLELIDKVAILQLLNALLNFEGGVLTLFGNPRLYF